MFNKFRGLSAILVLIFVSGLFLSSSVFANSTPHDLSTSDFTQNWTDGSLITANDDWSGVPSIDGLRGDGLGGTNTDPQTILVADDPGVIDVNANRNDPNSFNSGGLAEFDGIADPVVAFQGSGTADAPYLRISLNTTGRQDIQVSYNLRDIDGSNQNSVQQVALHYRVGNSGAWTNIPTAYIADASTGPSLATAVFPISETLPAVANDNAIVQIRVMTTNASGSDEFIGVDDIVVSSIAIPTPVVAAAVVDNNVSINGGADGQATASGSGGTPGYTYSWDDVSAQTTAIATGLAAGTYTVTVTDSTTTNSDTAMVTITEPAVLTSTASVTDETFFGANDGTATVVASGGVGPYMYLWSNGGTTATITGLMPGTYTVVVTDSNGATSSPAAPIVIAAALPPAIIPTLNQYMIMLLMLLVGLVAVRRVKV